MKLSHRLAALLPFAFCTFVTHANAQSEIASGIKSAENSIQTSNEKIFVSSQGGLYELKKSAGNWSKTALVAKMKDGSNANCYFLGIAENAGTVYSLCAENLLNPLAKKHLFALDSKAATPVANQVGEISALAFPNGLSSDGQGNLYAADAGLPLLAGRIYKITLASANSIASLSKIHQFIACKPNGVRYADGKLYVSVNPFSYVGLSQLLRYDVASNGLINQSKVYASWGFLDDFALVKNGLLVTEFISGKLRHINEQGDNLGSFSFAQPTSVTVLNNHGGLLVTERGNGVVKLMDNSWGVEKR